MCSRYEVYTTVQSIYCYKNTDVLRNKLHIKEQALLRKAEEDITQIKQMELLRNPIKGRFSKSHLLRIHKFIFGDIYPFAGKFRREQIAKADTLFYPPGMIDKELNKLFTKITNEKMSKEKVEEKVFENLAYVMAELNIIHPFREGNGRAIREFVRLIADSCGYRLNWGNVEKDKLLDASIKSVDSYKFLIEVLKQCAD